jgi:hypothetical protein
MPSQTTFARHAALVDRMADTLGVDLEERTLRGDVSVDEIGDAVLACTGCESPGACGGWLDSHAEGAGQPPRYCRNADLFARLTPG